MKIYENSFYHAGYDSKDSDNLIITLTSRTSKKEETFFGEVFFQKTSYDVIYIRSNVNDWYVGGEFKKCLQEIGKIISTKNYKNIIAYGTSMGGVWRNMRDLCYQGYAFNFSSSHLEYSCRL
ncbi:hypothetical protein [Paracoccus indicus]|uniref:hypothetical protein n=1 Tax=Paracoccus indicus TaxID=2079229 RepID=UPI0013B46E4F|nr:hypothetical protein [Paracoccus indicus]